MSIMQGLTPATQIGHMKTASGNTPTGMHTGDVVTKVVQNKRITHAALARAVGRSQSRVSRMLKEPNCHANLIWDLSLALRHNLFADIAAQLDAATEGRLQQDSVSVVELQAELQRVREERDTLLRAVDKLSR